MTAKNKWLAGIGIILGVILLSALPFIWQALLPNTAFGMMGCGPMPMMRGFAPMHAGYGGFPFLMLLVWMLALGLLILIGLGIASLIKYLGDQPS